MQRVLRVALAQVNPIVGDLDGNARMITDRIKEAREKGADVVCFPELALTGYPPEALVLKPSFVRDNLKQLESVVAATAGISAVVGFVDDDGEIFNAAAFIRDRELKAVYHKVFLPNYGVFDEERYFAVGHRCPIFEQNGVRIGVTVCEDCWYPSGPMAWQAEHGAELMVNINGSPFHGPLEKIRHEAEGAARLELDVTEVLINSKPEAGRPPLKPQVAEPLEGAAEVYAAVVLGTRDYIHKQRFKKVIIGMSGGVDSALTATVAADALGPENVIGVRMPSRHTSDESLE